MRGFSPRGNRRRSYRKQVLKVRRSFQNISQSRRRSFTPDRPRFVTFLYYNTRTSQSVICLPRLRLGWLGTSLRRWDSFLQIPTSGAVLPCWPLAVVSTSIVTGELACQAHRNLSFWEPRTPRQLAVYKPSSSVGWGARDPATREALP